MLLLSIQGITQKGNIKKIKIGYFVVAGIQLLLSCVVYHMVKENLPLYMLVGPVIMLVMGLFAASAEKMNDNLSVPVNKKTLIIFAAIAGCIFLLSMILPTGRKLFGFKLKHLWFLIHLDTILAIIFIGCVTIIKKLTMKESLILGIAASAGFLLSRLIKYLLIFSVRYNLIALIEFINFIFNAVIIMACSAVFGCIVKKINEKKANKIN